MVVRSRLVAPAGLAGGLHRPLCPALERPGGCATLSYASSARSFTTSVSPCRAAPSTTAVSAWSCLVHDLLCVLRGRRSPSPWGLAVAAPEPPPIDATLRRSAARSVSPPGASLPRPGPTPPSPAAWPVPLRAGRLTASAAHGRGGRRSRAAPCCLRRADGSATPGSAPHPRKRTASSASRWPFGADPLTGSDPPLALPPDHRAYRASRFVHQSTCIRPRRPALRGCAGRGLALAPRRHRAAGPPDTCRPSLAASPPSAAQLVRLLWQIWAPCCRLAAVVPVPVHHHTHSGRSRELDGEPSCGRLVILAGGGLMLSGGVAMPMPSGRLPRPADFSSFSARHDVHCRARSLLRCCCHPAPRHPTTTSRPARRRPRPAPSRRRPSPRHRRLSPRCPSRREVRVPVRRDPPCRRTEPTVALGT